MDYKSKARQLQNKAKQFGIDIPYTKSLELISSMYGHKSRHSLLKEKPGKFRINLSIEEVKFLLDNFGGCAGRGNEKTSWTITQLKENDQLRVYNSIAKDWWWKFKVGFDPNKEMNELWVQEYYESVDKKKKANKKKNTEVSQELKDVLGRLNE